MEVAALLPRGKPVLISPLRTIKPNEHPTQPRPVYKKQPQSGSDLPVSNTKTVVTILNNMSVEEVTTIPAVKRLLTSTSRHVKGSCAKLHSEWYVCQSWF